MSLYKECKKLIISSPTPHHHHFMLSIPPSPPAKMGGHDNAKGHKENATILQSRSDWKRGSVGILPGIFSPNRDDF
jgi:hypothetical protein